jgi:hypothetical protein
MRFRITPEIFNNLPLEQRAQFVWNEGYLIDTRTTTPHTYYQLHLLNGFYAELICDVESAIIKEVRVILRDEAARLYRAFSRVRAHHHGH